ncbi:hypothetical protein EVAR_97767_1 [Eumeta japonica]|uniref:Uncharacterized protein n=1 Tax=Eumeta variegata TaxID=151549 RepID=A0A4C1Y5Z0_EUMVA|nr:hypothetical protein EVAR_97767_1 [Eumeta japonica]
MTPCVNITTRYGGGVGQEVMPSASDGRDYPKWSNALRHSRRSWGGADAVPGRPPSPDSAIDHFKFPQLFFTSCNLFISNSACGFACVDIECVPPSFILKDLAVNPDIAHDSNLYEAMENASIKTKS